MHRLRSKITTKKVASQRQYTQSIERMQHADKKKKEKEGLQATGKKMWSFYELWSREEANEKEGRLTRHLFDQPRRETKEKIAEFVTA